MLLGISFLAHNAIYKFNTQSELEQWVPASTPAHASGRSSPQSVTTQAHARALRAQLEALEDIRHSRTELVERAQRLAASDDIKPRIMREEANLARWVSVSPALFEDTMAEEMTKYDRFRDDVEEGALKQEEVLEHIKV